MADNSPINEPTWTPRPDLVSANPADCPYEVGTGSPSTAPIPPNIVTGGRFDKHD